jgi:hypothetical protein
VKEREELVAVKSPLLSPPTENTESLGRAPVQQQAVGIFRQQGLQKCCIKGRTWFNRRGKEERLGGRSTRGQGGKTDNMATGRGHVGRTTVACRALIVEYGPWVQSKLMGGRN